MLDWTDRHCRYFHRLLSRHALLYTEMVTTGALVHGDVPRAFSMNPLAMLLLPAIPMMIAHGQGWRPRTLEPVMRVLLAPRFWLVLLPAYWIARNLPWFPFSMLAPG